MIEKIHALIRNALNQALRWDYLRSANPALAVERPKYKKGKRAVLSDAEAKARQNEGKTDLASEYQDFNLVVAPANGRPYETRQIDRKLKAFIADKNLNSVIFHSLRHSSASIKLKVSKGDTGHAVSNMIRTYTAIFLMPTVSIWPKRSMSSFLPLQITKKQLHFPT